MNESSATSSSPLPSDAAAETGGAPRPTLGLLTLARYLAFQRGAIRDIAATPRALLVGLVFVVSAGLAREYDRRDLLAEGWHLLLPLGVSLVTSLVLFALVATMAWIRGAKLAILPSYRAFLSLYWWMAPMAWLYAVPYEQFLDPLNAVRANLLTLGLVALWRVLLMTRVVSVLFGCHFVAAFFLVMLFADAVAFSLISAADLPVVDIMGGVRLSEAESLLRDVACTVIAWGILTAPLWIGGTLAVALLAIGGGRSWDPGFPDAEAWRRVSRPLWLVAILSVVAGVSVLPWSQPAQQRASRVTRLLKSGAIDEGLAAMRRAGRDAFPPDWDPPPRPGYREREPELDDVLAQLVLDEQHDWVWQLYAAKLKQLEFLPDLQRQLNRPRPVQDQDLVRVLVRLEFDEGRLSLTPDQQAALVKLRDDAPASSATFELIERILDRVDVVASPAAEPGGDAGDDAGDDDINGRAGSRAPAPEDDQDARRDPPPRSDVR